MIIKSGRCFAELHNAFQNAITFQSKISDYTKELHATLKSKEVLKDVNYTEIITKNRACKINIGDSCLNMISPYYWETNPQVLLNILKNLKPSHVLLDITPNEIEQHHPKATAILSHMFNSSDHLAITKSIKQKNKWHRSFEIDYDYQGSYYPSKLNYQHIYTALAWCTKEDIPFSVISSKKQKLSSKILDDYSYLELLDLFKVSAKYLGATPDCAPRTVLSAAALLYPQVFIHHLNCQTLESIYQGLLPINGGNPLLLTGAGQPEVISLTYNSNDKTSLSDSTINSEARFIKEESYITQTTKISLIDVMLEESNQDTKLYNPDSTSLRYLQDISQIHSIDIKLIRALYKESKQDYYELRKEMYKTGKDRMYHDFYILAGDQLQKQNK